MRYYKFLYFIVLIIISCAHGNPENTSNSEENYSWNDLIDADLSKWDIFLSYQHQLGYNGSQPKDENGELIPLLV